MNSLIIPLCCSATLIAGAAIAGGALSPNVQAQTRVQAADAQWDVQFERSRWSTVDPVGPADANVAAEARRTLDLIDRLDAQRERLWAYYRAVEAHHVERETLARERGELEALVNRHSNRLRDLEQDLDRLRPRSGGISFTPSSENKPD